MSILVTKLKTDTPTIYQLPEVLTQYHKLPTHKHLLSIISIAENCESLFNNVHLQTRIL